MKSTMQHGGGLDAAMADHGGRRDEWLDLSTGINPLPYPVEGLPGDIWHSLPDEALLDECLAAARTYYSVPDDAAIVAAPGTQAIIQWLPELTDASDVSVISPTYNEYFRSYARAGIMASSIWEPEQTDVCIVGNPNNPDGRIADPEALLPLAKLTIVDEAFCDVAPDKSFVPLTGRQDLLVLKSFGKFFGLAGIRLGFAIGPSDKIRQLQTMLGPWAVSGPALAVGAKAMADRDWIGRSRERLRNDSNRLKALVETHGMRVEGASDLFVLASHVDSETIAKSLAEQHILVRVFDYDPDWIRFGLPLGDDEFDRLSTALGRARQPA